MIPLSSQGWIDDICVAFDVAPDFWIHRKFNNWFSPEEEVVITIMILRLRLRHYWEHTEIRSALRLSAGSLSTYTKRGYAVLAVEPEVERAFTKIEGEQATRFLLTNFRPLFMLLADADGVSG
jgi:hypothetical protein